MTARETAALRRRIRATLVRHGMTSFSCGIVADVLNALTVPLAWGIRADGRRGHDSRLDAVRTAIGHHRSYLGGAAASETLDADLADLTPEACR